MKSLRDSFVLLNEGAKKPRSRIFISKAVIVLCQARKCRDADHLQNFVYDREMIDGRELLKSINEARANPENIPLPEYTFDVHTRKGRAKGKTKADFFQQEFAALHPKEPGEFDRLIK